MPFIEVSALTKTFSVRKKREKGLLLRAKQEITALDRASFTVEKGELVGYIGPNGAGKSTTVKLLSGILTPSSGTASVGGLVPWEKRKEHVRRIGVVFGQRTQLWWDVPPSDSYQLLRDIYRVPDAAFRRRLSELCEALDLAPILHTPLRQLSLGQRMRAELAGSLLHSPELLFLDEPTIGLDAVSKLALRAFLLKENREHGTTILLTTHDMEDISALCPRVMVLGHGKLLYDGALSHLLDRYDTVRTAHIKYESGALPPLPDCCLVTKNDDGYAVSYPRESMTADALLKLIQTGGSVKELTVRERSLDEMIAQMYGEMSL